MPFLGSAPLVAAPYLWDGGSLADSFIATPENWDPDGAPPSDLTTDLVFDGTARLAPNFSLPFSANSLTFNDNAAGKTLTVQNGGHAIFADGYSQTTDATTDVSGSGSTFTTARGFEFLGNSALNITDGGSFSNSAWTNLAASDWGNATVLVDGAGSSFSTAEVFIGANGYTGTLTFANGTTGSIGYTGMATSYGSTGRLHVQSGSTLTMCSLLLTQGYVGDNGGEFTVDGAGPVVTQTAGALLILGDSGGSSANLTAGDGGTFTSGTGTVYLNESGTLSP